MERLLCFLGAGICCVVVVGGGIFWMPSLARGSLTRTMLREVDYEPTLLAEATMLWDRMPCDGYSRAWRRFTEVMGMGMGMGREHIE